MTPREGGGFSGTMGQPQVGRRIVIPRIQIPTIPDIDIAMPEIVIPSIPSIDIQLPRVRVVKTGQGPI